DLDDRYTAGFDCFHRIQRLLRTAGPHHRNDADLADSFENSFRSHGLAASAKVVCSAGPARLQRAMRADCPFMRFCTSCQVAMDVSPGVVMARAPCAAPHSRDHCTSCPLRSPYSSPEAKESPPPTRSKISRSRLVAAS